jgi:hypothetical protein
MNTNDVIERYKDGEMFERFTDKQLKTAQIINFIIMFISILFIVKYNNIITKIAFFIILLHYSYRSYKINVFIKKKYDKSK